MSLNISMFFYLISAVLFILSLRGLSTPATSKRGNLFGMIGMAIAILTTIALPNVSGYTLIILGIVSGGAIGYFIAKMISMNALPQLVAAFHSLVGLAAVFVAAASLISPSSFGIGFSTSTLHASSLIEMSLGAAIGAITFTGSIIAFGKLQGLISGKSIILFPAQQKINAIIALGLVGLICLFTLTHSVLIFSIIVAASLLLGLLLILPIGGADMPVIVSMLNSYSGWAAAGIGFTLQNNLLIITGALVGASGAILSHIMCKGMNRSLMNVILGGFGSSNSEAQSGEQKEHANVKLCSPEDAAFIMKNANSIIVVPGYGMAVAQAQHALKEIAEILAKEEDIKVRYAIHPVAGRMPGHMNVLLAEANIDNEDVFEIDEINHEFSSTDVAFVIGANDITNPAAKTDKTSPIYGMPVLDVEKAKTVFFVKRSLSSGYAGIDNPLFYQSNTMMILGDAKKVCESILKAMKE